jgi:hypothetical protein
MDARVAFDPKFFLMQDESSVPPIKEGVRGKRVWPDP